MLLEYRTIFRNLKANGIYSTIGITGLAMGVIASVLLFLYVLDQLNYDANYVHGGPIYTINTHVKLDGSEFTTATGPAPLADVMKNEISGVLETSRMVKHKRVVIQFQNQKFFEDKVFYADSKISKFFDYRFLEGKPDNALDAPNTIILTKSLAKKYFGNGAAIDQLLEIDGTLFKVTGVIEDPTKKAHFIPRAFMSLSSMDPARNTVWASLNDHTYVRLDAPSAEQNVEQLLVSVTNKYTKDIYARFNATVSFFLQPLADIHFGGVQRETIDASLLGSLSDIYLAVVVAFLILLLASANYAILSVAASIKRAKEVGMRKILGASRRQLILQYLFESVVVVLLVFLFGLAFIYFVAPAFSFDFLTDASIGMLLRWETLWFVFGVAVIVGLVCAGYPAWYLSVFEPITVLKGGASDNLTRVPFKKVLLFIQLTLASFMLSGMWIMYDQYTLTSKIDMGFNPDNVVKLEMTGNESLQQYSALRNSLKSIPGVKEVASATAVPGSPGFDANSFMIQKEAGGFELMVTTNFRVSQEYADVLDIQVTSGRFFSEEHGTDENAVIVNEALVKQFGWTDPIGKQMEKVINQNMDKEYYKVIGVVKDFKLQGLNEKSMPVAILYRKISPLVLLKLNSNPDRSLIAEMSRVWENIVVNQPFELNYVRDSFDSQYRQEANKAITFALFTLLAVLIAFVGIFGIVSYDVRQRARELALRLILGATGMKISFMLNRDYAKVIVAASVVAILFSYYVMTYYLETFVNRVSIGSSSFLAAILIISVITLSTIVWHVASAVTKNPKNALKQD